MAHDDIPEDQQPSYQCPHCDGSVTLNKDEQVWECDSCEFFAPFEEDGRG